MDLWKDVTRQMLPFVILLVILWLTAELLERTLTGGRTILAPPAYATPTPTQPVE